MSDFTPDVAEYPMTLYQYEEQSRMLADPSQIGDLSIEELRQMQFDRQRFLSEREKRNQRLKQQGLSDSDIAQLDDAERQVTIDPNDPSMKNKVLQNPQKDVAGMVEGGKQAIEGVADLAMDISVAVGADDDQSKQAWKEGVRQRRMESRKEHIETFGTLPGNGWEIVGQTVPWLAASTGQAAKYTHFLARQGMLGGLGAASQVQPSSDELGDRWLDVTFGTALGTVLGGAMGAPGALKRAGSRSIVKAFNDADSQQREVLELMVQEMTGNPNFKFSAAQLTGSRFYTNLEVGAADKLTKEQQNKNLDILLNNILQTAKAQSANGMSAGAIAAGMKNTLQTARDTIYRNASNDWRIASEAIVERYGDEVIIDGGEYLHKLDKIIETEMDAVTNMGAKPSKALLDYRKEVDDIVNPIKVSQEGDKVYIVDVNDPSMKRRILAPTEEEALRAAHEAAANANAARGPDPQQTLRMVRGLNRLIGGETAVFENVAVGNNRNLGRALMGALTGEMSNGTGSSEAATRAIQLLRQGYRQDMAAAQAIDESVFAAVFGGKKVPKNPGKALDQVMKGEPGEVRQLRKFLEEWNPELLGQMQRTALKRATLRSGARPGAANVDGGVDLNKFADNLADGFKREGRFGSGIFSPETQAEIMTTAAALRVLANKQFKGIVPGGARVEEFTINLISRSPEFAGRFITRLFASGRGLEDALLNPEWRHALRTIAGKDINSDTGRAAILYLGQWWADREESAKNERAQEEQVRSAQQFGADPARGGTVQ
jgi:hypothetical protein